MKRQLLLLILAIAVVTTFARGHGLGQGNGFGTNAQYSVCRLNDGNVVGYVEDISVAKGGFWRYWYSKPPACRGLGCFVFDDDWFDDDDDDDDDDDHWYRPRGKKDDDDDDDDDDRRHLLGKGYKDDDDDDDDDHRRHLLGKGYKDDDDDDDDDHRRRLLENEDNTDDRQHAILQVILQVPPCCEEYIVSDPEGESACAIASKFGFVDCTEFMQFNSLEEENLAQGQTVQIC